MPEAVPMPAPIDFALGYAALGWHVLPVEPRAKQPLGRLVPRGALDATTAPDTIRAWWRKAPAANIGIALAPSGLVAVDVDPRNGGADTFEQLQIERGSLRSDVMAFTGGGGEHHVFAVPPGVQLSLPGTLGRGVDLKSRGYIVVEPSVHPSGKPYGWEVSSNPLAGAVPPPLPEWLRDMRADSPVPQTAVSDKPADPKQMRDAREALYLLDADEYAQWVHAGMALHATGWGQAAYALWCAWAAQSAKFDGAASLRKWQSFHSPEERGTGVSLAWIFGEAQRRGWTNPAARLREVVSNAEPPSWAVELPPLGEVDGGPAKPRAEQLPLLTLQQLQERAGSIRWLVKGVVPLESLGMMFGASGTFKSFIAIDLSLHVGHGLPWMGRKTRQAPVIIIAAEGGAGLWRRIEAWHRDRGIAWNDAPVYVLPMAIDLAVDSARVIEAAKAVGVVPGLVVVDTLSQTFSGEENSAAEVSGYLRELLLWFRDSWQCAVLVVHHTGHQVTERPRGSSAMRANVDFLLGVHRDEKEMLATLSCSKQKDGELPADATFALSVFELDRDEDGDPVTALVARAVMDEGEQRQLIHHEAEQGRSGRNSLIRDLACNGMREQELRKVFHEECGAATADAKRQAYWRAKDWAVKHAFLEFKDGIVLVIDGTDRDKGA